MKPITFLSMMFLTAITLMTASASKAMSTISVSNQGRICGLITESITNQLLELVSIELFSCTDSSLVAGTITNKKGEFNFSMIKTGDYYLVVSFGGFETRKIEPVVVRKDVSKVNLGEIQINRSLRKTAKTQSYKNVSYSR
jgi:hypothetical protein